MDGNYVYSGLFDQNNKLHGFGRMEWKGDYVYEGMWVHGEEHGFGRIIFATEAVYIGNWKGGNIKHGEFKIIESDGSIREEGIYKNDKLKKSQKVIFKGI